MNVKRIIAAGMAAGLLLTVTPVLAEEATEAQAISQVVVDTQKLDASYTLALNAINAEDYETAKEYLSICFAYSDPQSNPAMYADLLLKRACIDVIEEKNDMALLNLDAAIRVQPDLADAYLVRTQVYAAQGNVDAAIENLEKYIELTEDTSLYETVAQLNEAKGDIAAAQAAYDKYVEGAGGEVAEAGFQSALYKMQAGRLEEAIAGFEAYANDETYAAGAAYNTGICKMNLGDYAGAIEATTPGPLRRSPPARRRAARSRACTTTGACARCWASSGRAPRRTSRSPSRASPTRTTRGTTWRSARCSRSSTIRRWPRSPS